MSTTVFPIIIITVIVVIRLPLHFYMLRSSLPFEVSNYSSSSSFSSFSSSFWTQLFVFAELCSFNCFSSFFSFFAASCLHFVLLFWNQTFTCVSDKPNMAPIWSRSRLVTYLVAWKRFSRPRRCSWVKTGRHQGRVQGFSLGAQVFLYRTTAKSSWKKQTSFKHLFELDWSL